MPNFIDPLGRTVNIPENPQRIISLCPSITETLYELGLESRIVGRTLFCIHPKTQVDSVQRIGGTKNVDLERIAELKPDLIIAEKEENLENTVLALEKDYPTYVMDVTDLKSAWDMMAKLGEICGTQTESAHLVTEILASWKKVVPLTTPKRTAYFIWKSPYMLAGRDTFIDAVMAACRLENVYNDMDSRYPEITIEELRALSPEVILLSSEPYPFTEIHIADFQNYFPDATVVIVDGEMFSWYGSRMLQAPSYLQSILESL